MVPDPGRKELLPDFVREGLRSPYTGVAVLLLLVSFVYAAITGFYGIVAAVGLLLVMVYVLYLFVRLVVAVEAIADDR